MLKILIWPGFILLLLAQWFVPLQMIWSKNKILSQGKSYKFETAPVDPSDPFMGKYIVLNFKESSLMTTDAKKFSYNGKVYVRFLTGNDGFAKVGSINVTTPQTDDYLETTISYISEMKDSSVVFLTYPFTRYYMEEYKAPKAESIYRDRIKDSTLKTYALVNIYKGDAVIKDVYINDTLINDVIKTRDAVR
ncbi:MAG: GDYXXLXY domain-containing protein [Chitinophagaceae bacterium]